MSNVSVLTKQNTINKVVDQQMLHILQESVQTAYLCQWSVPAVLKHNFSNITWLIGMGRRQKQLGHIYFNIS